MLEGYEFEGWFLKDGTEFKFEQIQTKSATLYAKYSGNEGIIYVASEEGVDAITNTLNYGLLITGGALVAVGITVCVICVKKGAGNGKKKAD